MPKGGQSSKSQMEIFWPIRIIIIKTTDDYYNKKCNFATDISGRAKQALTISEMVSVVEMKPIVRTVGGDRYDRTKN